MTVIELWNQFLAERSIALSPTSLVTDYRQAAKWLQRCPVQDALQGRQVMIWVLGQQPVLSARRMAMFVKAMYRWAAQEDVALLPRNPLLSFRMPKPPQRDDEIVVIPRAETAMVLAALESKNHHRGTRWSLYAEFMLQTAMRTGEVRAMRWNDIKDSKVLVHSNYTLTHGLKNSTKTNKRRWVPLNARCRAILDELPAESEFIFPWNRQAFQSYFRSKMQPLHRAGLISHVFRPYDCRHTAISRWVEAGIPVPQIAAWAGNTSEVIFKHYANSTKEWEIPCL